MMATTHALVGLAVGLGALVVSPEAALAPLVGFAGGLLPDLDIYAGHRRTLHFPVALPALAAAALPVAALVGTPLAVTVAAFLLAAALHCAMDVLGGGLELRPWEGTSERAVYDHVRGTWLPPRRWVPYDGSPEDLALAGVAAAPAVAVASAPVRDLALLALAVSALWVAVRRPVAALSARLATLAPAPVRPYLPARFLED